TIKSTNLIIPIGPAGDGAARLEKHGLLVTVDPAEAVLEEPLPGSPFEGLSRSFDFYGEQFVTIS
ncbi:MAG: hypothetical protein GWN51_02355, partial [Gemmatimonadetes bacterium]|nr:hypothetical protein [Gemmatimonadota bacterium]